MSKYILFTFIIILSLAWVSTDPDPKTKAELGKILFFDPILSKDSTISCASCHKPEFAFADNVPLSFGVDDRLGKRNAPTVMNMSSRGEMFFDGRADNLIHQVVFPIEDTNEMNLPINDAVSRLQNHTSYKQWFLKLYNEIPNQKNLADAIAAFEETLETSDTEFDAYMMDKPNSMSASAIRGREFFMSDRAKCFDCHFSPDFTGDEYKNIGLYDGKKFNDQGRYEVTKSDEDLGKFKVPGLRNIEMTAPYMHDGSFKTLREVIDYYSNPYDFVTNPINMDSTLLKAIHFTESEKIDLESFLKSLTDRRFTK